MTVRTHRFPYTLVASMTTEHDLDGEMAASSPRLPPSAFGDHAMEMNMPTARPRVLLADDHGLLAAGICRLLEKRYEVVGIVDNGRALIKALRVERPDVILTRLSMLAMSSLEATRELRRSLSETPVIVLTMNDDPNCVKAAFAAGAVGYLTKSSAPRELFEAIRQVLAGGRYLNSFIAGQVIGTLITPEPAVAESPLTPREIEIAALVGGGLENVEIADRLCIAEVTVRTHFYRTLQKLQIRNRVQLARHALAEGWVSLNKAPLSN